MAPRILPVSVSALHEILSWCGDRPDWQRDALRRIVLNGTLSTSDLDQLERICRTKHGVDPSSDPPIVASPLDASHLPPAPGKAASVALVALRKLVGVNRLPSCQELVFGAMPGLTIVFGGNGAGKSGYARVIKKACRTRGALPVIRPNCFQPAKVGPATAEVEFQVGGTNTLAAWTDGIASRPELSNVFVFDSSTAKHYLTDDGPAVFTPHGLDVLPKLSKACDDIGGRIDQESKRLTQEIASIEGGWTYSAATAVGKAVAALSATTKPADIEKLATVSDLDAQRLRELNDILKSDAKQKARETRASSQRIRAFAGQVRNSETELSEKRCDIVKTVIETAHCTAAAGKEFASGQFDSSHLKGTGGDLWRKMFDAARAYSAGVAYEGQTFPVTGDDGRCVLCQRELDRASAQRLRAFDAFCANQSQKLADDAENAVVSEAKRLAALQTISPELEKIAADLEILSEEKRAAMKEFARVSDLVLSQVTECVTGRKWKAPEVLPASGVAVLDAAVKTLDERAVLEESADDPVAKAKLIQERDELAAKEWLKGVKAEVLRIVEKHKRISLLKECAKDTATTKLTAKNTDLTKQIVTDAFRKRFEDEVKVLGLQTVKVVMEDIGGKKGETRFGLRLKDAQGHRVEDIASEGEQRCVALAAFLAELSQASHQSSLVFDDPVSSLDHVHHQRIAERLVAESKTRQVVVFTHSTGFLHDLQAAAMEGSIEPSIVHLEWNGGVPGFCREGLPWDWKTTKDRFERLEQFQRKLEKSWNPVPNEDNTHDMRRAYSWLRATLERIVEREIFADVVFRFRLYVNVKKLDEVVGLSKQECEEIQRLTQHCHDVTEAHDVASGKPSTLPDPAKFLQDIKAAKALVELIHKRRKNNSSPAKATPARAVGTT